MIAMGTEMLLSGLKTRIWMRLNAAVKIRNVWAAFIVEPGTVNNSIN